MDCPGEPALRRARAGAPARRRNDSLEAHLAHRIFDPYRPWLDRLRVAGGASLEALNALARESDLRTESAQPVRFVPPAPSDPYYEIRAFETGCIQTRPDNRHDLFNALAWLAFPRTKARINALHAVHIPREQGRRGRFRDLLTIFDEGGAIVSSSDPCVAELVRGFRWKELFWERRAHLLRTTRFIVLGHAILEQALEPRAGITCKTIFVDEGQDADVQASEWLSTLPAGATPRDLAALPVFGYPGWHEETASAEFYDDTRYFRVKSPAGVGQAAAVRRQTRAEESPGSEERDAG
jgi:hypothetical protein